MSTPVENRHTRPGMPAAGRHACRKIILLMLALWPGGCSGPASAPVAPQPVSSRIVDTPAYLEQALARDEQENRFIFFSWRGTLGTEGCRLPVYVYDAPANVPSTFDAEAVRAGITHGSNQWKQAVRDLGIPCETVIAYESAGALPFSEEPRIEIRFNEALAAGVARGNVLVEVEEEPRKFRRVRMRIATIAAKENGLSPLNREDYLKIFTHEFGHAFGIYCFGSCQGHSTNSNDVMFSSNRYSTLSLGDKATLTAIITGEAYYIP